MVIKSPHISFPFFALVACDSVDSVDSVLVTRAANDARTDIDEFIHSNVTITISSDEIVCPVAII